MATDVDLLVLGGGCAGLSLATQLADGPRINGSTLVMESRPAYVHDRIWSFWRTAPHRFESLVAHQWTALRVSTGAGNSVLDCHAMPYQSLFSGAFYEHCQDRIGVASGIDLALDTRVIGAPRPTARGWQVSTSAGDVSARQIVDTRPTIAARTDAVLWQSFLGEEVECDEPCFESGVATLMDFVPEVRDAIAFVYVLPFSRTRALIEFTVFGPARLGALELEAAQRRSVARLTRDVAHVVLRREAGILPMGLRSTHEVPQRSYVRAGIAGGAARPSTGFAFQRIQRWASAAANSVREGGGVVAPQESPAMERMMDALFLRVLRDQAVRAPEIFQSLFTSGDATHVIRFLSDGGDLRDKLHVICRLPALLFLQQVWQSMHGTAAPQAAVR